MKNILNIQIKFKFTILIKTEVAFWIFTATFCEFACFEWDVIWSSFGFDILIYTHCIIDPKRNKQIRISSVFKVRQLSTIGGTDVKETVRRLLSAIVTNQLATQLNWMGKGTKVAFSSLRLKDVLYSEYFNDVI